MRPTRLIAALLASIPPIAASVSLAAEPQYFVVSGVASNDVLNVRAEPDPKTQIVDQLSPGAGPVEVLEVVDGPGGQWARVLAADGNGWVAMRFLSAVGVARIAGTDVPDGLQCFGTEPFWDLTLAGNGLRYSAMDGQAVSLPVSAGLDADGRNHRFWFTARGPEQALTALIGRNEVCSDGMSDRDYGWRVDLLIEGVDGRAIASREGCCRLPLSR